jgi:hypothetical protein
MAKHVMVGKDVQRFLAKYDIVPEVCFSEQDIADDVWESPPGCIVYDVLNVENLHTK